MNLRIEAKGYVSEPGKKRKRLVFTKKHDPTVENFIKWISAALFYTTGGAVSMTDITGTSRSVTWYATTRCQVNGPEGNTNYGIMVGTGTNAVTMGDYALQTQIAHGNGASQLYHEAVTFGIPATSGYTRYFDFWRSFANNSGGDITVNEIGLYIYPTSQSYYYMYLRDVLSSGITLSNGQALTVKYRITITA